VGGGVRSLFLLCAADVAAGGVGGGGCWSCVVGCSSRLKDGRVQRG
jgi:hypothetical protein